MEGVRTKLPTSTPAVSKVRDFFNDGNKPPSDIGLPTENVIKKATYLDMVIEAITEIGLPKQGASYQAIKKWILVNKEADPMRLKTSLKLAVLNGVNKGVLVRSKKSETTVGAKGFFMLPVKKVFKSTKQTTNKLKSTNKIAQLLPKSNNKTSPAKAEATKKVISPSQDKKTAAKTKKIPKEAEAEKIVARKVNSKAEVQKKSPAKLPSNVKAVKKRAAKASSNEVEDAPKAAAKASSKVKKVNSPEENYLFFSDSQSDEDSENADVSMQGLKKGKLFSESESDDGKRGKVNSKLPTKKKTVKNNGVKSIEGGESVIKDKGKAAKDTKKRGKPNATSKNQTKLLRKTAGKKLYSSENELENQVSDTEIDNKKIHNKGKLKRNIHKSYLSDTEFEISKRGDKKNKKVLRAKKV